MFDTTITIYNLVKNREGDTFQRTVIKTAHWEDEEGITLGKSIVKSDDNIVVVIPMSVEGFVLPKAFQKLTDKKGKWTLAGGDFIVKGELDTEITKAKDLLDLDQVMTISAYEVNDQARMKRLNNYTANGK